METRLITLADAQKLAALHQVSFAESAWTAAQIAGSLVQPSTRGWVSEEEGRPVAFILFQITQDEAEILTFCVAPTHRRKGLGATLLETAFGQMNTGRIFLEVAADNVAAVRLYEKAGFRLNGRRKAYYPHGTGAVDAVMLVWKRSNRA